MGPLSATSGDARSKQPIRLIRSWLNWTVALATLLIAVATFLGLDKAKQLTLFYLSATEIVAAGSLSEIGSVQLLSRDGQRIEGLTKIIARLENTGRARIVAGEVKAPISIAFDSNPNVRVLEARQVASVPDGLNAEIVTLGAKEIQIKLDLLNAGDAVVFEVILAGPPVEALPALKFRIEDVKHPITRLPYSRGSDSPFFKDLGPGNYALLLVAMMCPLVVVLYSIERLIGVWERLFPAKVRVDRLSAAAVDELRSIWPGTQELDSSGAISLMLKSMSGATGLTVWPVAALAKRDFRSLIRTLPDSVRLEEAIRYLKEQVISAASPGRFMERGIQTTPNEVPLWMEAYTFLVLPLSAIACGTVLASAFLRIWQH